jgi:hypothetical protein
MNHSKLPLTAWFWAAYRRITSAVMFLICPDMNPRSPLQRFV